ncbi:MAG: hypothetical protein WAQ05_00670, partial [Rubrivivax sp.]
EYMGSTGAPPAAWQGPWIEEVQTAANPLISGRCVFKQAEPALMDFEPARAQWLLGERMTAVQKMQSAVDAMQKKAVSSWLVEHHRHVLATLQAAG